MFLSYCEGLPDLDEIAEEGGDTDSVASDASSLSRPFKKSNQLPLSRRRSIRIQEQQVEIINYYAT